MFVTQDENDLTSVDVSLGVDPNWLLENVDKIQEIEIKG